MHIALKFIQAATGSSVPLGSLDRDILGIYLYIHTYLYIDIHLFIFIDKDRYDIYVDI
jgi:hypothetical protein